MTKKQPATLKVTSARVIELTEACAAGKHLGTLEEWRYIGMYYKGKLWKSARKVNSFRDLVQELTKAKNNLARAEGELLQFAKLLDDADRKES
jgi:hypothetical protein